MSYNLGVDATVRDFYSRNNAYRGYINGSLVNFNDKELVASNSITFTGTTLLNSTSGTSYPSNVVFSAPKIIFNNSDYGISIWNNGKNSMTFNNASVNFDNAIFNTDSTYIGPISFTGDSSLDITYNSNNKTLIKASTLTGTIGLNIDESQIVDSVSFSIQAATNNLTINAPTGWTITPTVDGTTTTYAVARIPKPNVKELNINGETYQIKDEYTRNQLTSIEQTKQDVINDLDTIRSGAAAGATAVQPSDLIDYVTVDTDQTISGGKTFSGINSFTGSLSVQCSPGVYSGNYFGFPQTVDGITVYRPAIKKDDSDNTFNLGYSSFNLRLAGLETRPKYNNSDLALKSDVPTDTNDLTNGAGYITSSALNGYATQTWVGQQGYLTSTALNGYATEEWVGQQGYLTGITSPDVTTALGYTPYNSSNPNGYTSNVGTVTSVNNVQPVNGNVSLTIPTVNNATLTIQKNGNNVATFTANSSTNQTANITVPTDNADLTNGAGYITGITGSDVTTALGYTPLQSSDILNVVNSTATNKALSANMGKELQDQIDNLKARGRYLALWNCATGLAQSNPTQSPYNYQTGDYFIIGTIATGSGTNYRPNGSSYTTGVTSTTVETEPVAVNDVYYYDGTNWSLQINTQKEVTFSSIGGSPYDNSNLASALNGKQAELVSGTNIKTINNNSILGSGNLSIDSLPSQSGQNGKYLKTNGTSASWATLDLTGYATEQWVGQQGYITGITSSDVTSALGYTPYNSSNPAGYTSNVGTVTSVNNVQPVNGNVTLSIPTQVTESTVSGWGFTKNLGTVTSVNNVSPVNGNVTLSIPVVEEYTSAEVDTLWNSITPSS